MTNLSIINVFMILQKPDIWERLGSVVMKGISESRMLWKESIDILVFLHEYGNQAKVTSDTTTFGSMWPVMLSV